MSSLKQKCVKNKKRVLIVVPSFSIGGIIVSLQSLLSVIDTNKYEIDIFALARQGVYLDKLSNCSILPENFWLSHRYYGKNRLKRIGNRILRLCCSVFSRLGLSIEPFMCKIADKYINFSLYDTIINYSESIANIVCYYPAKKRIAWVHCDYERYLTIVKRNEEKVYEYYDTVVCVSEFAKSKFCDCLPQMAAKTVAIHNVINADEIRSKAQGPIDDPKFVTDGFTMVSAGRLDPVKQFHLIPKLAADIKKKTDKKFIWYIIGGNRGFESYVDGIRKDIVDLGVSEEVVMLGEKNNVYPYMAKADLYVSTSLSESFPLVINEAKALGIPVVSNNFGSATESVLEGVDGFVVSLNDGAMRDRIVAILSGQLELQTRNNDEVVKSRNQQIINRIGELL